MSFEQYDSSPYFGAIDFTPNKDRQHAYDSNESDTSQISIKSVTKKVVTPQSHVPNQTQRLPPPPKTAFILFCDTKKIGVRCLCQNNYCNKVHHVRLCLKSSFVLLII